MTNNLLPDETFVKRWKTLELDFSKREYDGVGTPGQIKVIQPTSLPEILLTSVHGVNHSRNGAPKFADRGTGGLVLTLCEITGCAGVVVIGKDPGDANFDLAHNVKQTIESLSPTPRVILDFHGMKDRGVDLEIGTAKSAKYPEGFVNSLIVNSTFNVVVDEVFDASREGTLTRWAQSRGIQACQLEVSSKIRLPDGKTEKMSQLIDLLANTIRLIG